MSWKSGVAAEVIGIPKAPSANSSITQALSGHCRAVCLDLVIIIVSALFEHLFLYLLKKVRH